MCIIRHFTIGDAERLHECQYSNLPISDLIKLINEWNLLEYKGRYFEMFAIVVDEQIVGLVSLYQHDAEVVSHGIEIFAEYRLCGYALSGVKLALTHAKKRGYKVVVAQVKKDNIASISLHKKLGFVVDHEYTNAKGHKVYFCIMPIG